MDNTQETIKITLQEADGKNTYKVTREIIDDMSEDKIITTYREIEGAIDNTQKQLEEEPKKHAMVMDKLKNTYDVLTRRVGHFKEIAEPIIKKREEEAKKKAEEEKAKEAPSDDLVEEVYVEKNRTPDDNVKQP